MATRTLETWWSPAAQCYRIEDGEMFTYYGLDLVIGHLREREAAALISPPPHTGKTAELDRVLRATGIEVVYGAH
jgi:hypothetical protein